MSNYKPGMTQAAALADDDETLLDWLRVYVPTRGSESGEEQFWAYAQRRWMSPAEMVADVRALARWRAVMGSRSDVHAMNREGL